MWSLQRNSRPRSGSTVTWLLPLLFSVTTVAQVSSLPPSASYVYTTPALYLNKLTVQQVFNLGNLSTGGTQLLGNIVSGHLYSEPGFEPQFSGAVRYASDYLVADPGTDGIARPSVLGEIVPDNGDSPFAFRVTGIDTASPEAVAIYGTNTSKGLAVPYGKSYSVWTPTFYGGSSKYAVLQNSIFVASETVSDSDLPGYFLVGMKISKVWPVNTTITIGHEYP